MKWITHQTGAVFGCLALALPLPAIIASTFGAVAPDVIDQKFSSIAKSRRKRQRLFNKIHRGPSHWFGWWLALFLLSFSLPIHPLCRDACIGFSFGILSHVMLDLLTPHGVPLWPFSQRSRISLPICTTGTGGEYLLLLLMLASGAFMFRDSLIQTVISAAQYF